MKIAIVTASLDLKKSRDYWESWLHLSTLPTSELIFYPVVGVMGVVPAFKQGIDTVMEVWQPDVIACLHDDLQIQQPGWDMIVRGVFMTKPKVGLVGFGGGRGLGSREFDYSREKLKTEDIVPALARQSFISNMQDAEAHGSRVTSAQPVACLDGFSQIGRASFMQEAYSFFLKEGVIHHAFDSWLGVLAREAGWDVWMLPIKCHHRGGMTAVGSSNYQAWAKTQHARGDAGFWEESHKKFYAHARKWLPIWAR